MLEDGGDVFRRGSSGEGVGSRILDQTVNKNGSRVISEGGMEANHVTEIKRC